MKLRPSIATLALLTLPVSGTSFGQSINSCSELIHLPGTDAERQYTTVCNGLVQTHPVDTSGASTATGGIDVDGDLRPDLFAVINGQATVCSAPGVIGASVTLPLAVPAFYAVAPAIIPGSGTGVGTPIASMDYGLCTWSYDSQLEAWSAHAVSGTVNWSHASSLEVGDVDGDGTMELVGVFTHSPTQSIVRVAELSNGVLINEISKVYTATDINLSLVDYSNASPGEEVVLITGNRVFAFDGSLTQVLGFHWVNGNVTCATPVNDAIGGAVAVSFDAGGSDYIQLLRDGVAETPVALTLDVIAIGSAPQGLSGAGSLLIYAGDNVTTYTNQSDSGQEAFSGAPEYHYIDLKPILTSSVDIQPWIVASDFDNDGDVDVAMQMIPDAAASSDASMVAAINGSVVQESLMAPMFYLPTGDFPTAIVPKGAVAGDTVSFVVDVWNVNPAPIPSMSHLEITLFRDLEGMVGDPIAPYPLDNITDGTFTVSIPIPVIAQDESTYATGYLRTIDYDPATGDISGVGSDVRVYFFLSSWLGNDGVVPTGVTPSPPIPPAPGTGNGG